MIIRRRNGGLCLQRTCTSADGDGGRWLPRGACCTRGYRKVFGIVDHANNQGTAWTSRNLLAIRQFLLQTAHLDTAVLVHIEAHARPWRSSMTIKISGLLQMMLIYAHTGVVVINSAQRRTQLFVCVSFAGTPRHQEPDAPT